MDKDLGTKFIFGFQTVIPPIRHTSFSNNKENKNPKLHQLLSYLCCVELFKFKFILFVFQNPKMEPTSCRDNESVSKNSPGRPTDEAAAEMDRSKLHAVLKLASEASRSNKAVPLSPTLTKMSLENCAPEKKTTTGHLQAHRC